MQRNRVLLHPSYVEKFRGVLREAKADLAAMHDRHLRELQDLRAEIAELRDVLQLVVSITREQVEGDLASMRRQLTLALARLDQRDPTKPLH